MDYTGVTTIYRRLLRSGLGFGAQRWFSILDRKSQRILFANVPSSSHDFNNLYVNDVKSIREKRNIDVR